MTTYTFANLDKWATKSEERMNAIVRQALNDTLFNIEIVTAKARGGSPKPGEIPRDTGALAQSLVSEVHGGTPQRGSASYLAAISGIRAGEDAAFSWTVEYAVYVHYGTRYSRGLHWITLAAQKWQGYISAAAYRLRY